MWTALTRSTCKWAASIARRPNRFAAAIGLSLALAPAPVLADWPPLGRSLCSGCGAEALKAAADGTGGAFFFWTDTRNVFTTDEDVFMQRVLANGEIAPGWPAGGLPISLAIGSDGALDLTSDGAGGVIAQWQGRFAASAADLIAQRIRPDGSLWPGWLPQGVPVTLAPHHQFTQEGRAVVSDGAGGAYFVWEDWQQLGTPQAREVYIHRLTGDGVPAPGWPAYGRVMAAAVDEQMLPVVASDGMGGAIAAWFDYRDLPGDFPSLHGETFALRVLADGTNALGWPAGGLRTLPFRARRHSIIGDGQGGAYITHALPNAFSSSESVLVVQRLSADGAPALGWPVDGVVLCDAPQSRNIGPASGDLKGGVLIAWADGRDGEVYVGRLREDGTQPPGWPEDGLRVSGTEPNPFGEFDPVLAPDGNGGCYIAWEKSIGCCRLILVQHITAGGTVAPGWPSSGLQVLSTHSSASSPVLVADGFGGAILSFSSGGTLFAQKFVGDGVVATAVSLVRAEVHPNEVMLHWHAASGSFRAMLERRDGAEGEWIALAELTPDGTGAVRFTDRDVVPGARYGYRLRWDEHGAMRVAGETAVEVPSALRFALHGVHPNPARGEAQVAFTLPAWATGELEVLDVSGRRVAGREVGSLGPGRHVLRLDERDSLAPGLYLVRLRWRGESATTRAVLVR